MNSKERAKLFAKAKCIIAEAFDAGVRLSQDHKSEIISTGSSYELTARGSYIRYGYIDKAMLELDEFYEEEFE